MQQRSGRKGGLGIRLMGVSALVVPFPPLQLATLIASLVMLRGTRPRSGVPRTALERQALEAAAAPRFAMWLSLVGLAISALLYWQLVSFLVHVTTL